MRIGNGGNFLPLSGGTLTGSITLPDSGAIKWSDLKLKRQSAGKASLINIGDTAFLDLLLNDLIFTYVTGYDAASVIRSKNEDGAYFSIQTRDHGSGLVPVFRFRSAADPYAEASLPMVLLPATQPGTPVEGHFLYNSADDELYYRDASAWQRVLSTKSDTAITKASASLVYTDSSPKTLFQLPAGALVLAMNVKCSTQWDGVGATLAVGTAGSAVGLLPDSAGWINATGVRATGKMASVLGAYLYDADKWSPYWFASATNIIATVNHAASTQGACTIHCYYIATGLS